MKNHVLIYRLVIPRAEKALSRFERCGFFLSAAGDGEWKGLVVICFYFVSAYKWSKLLWYKNGVIENHDNFMISKAKSAEKTSTRFRVEGLVGEGGFEPPKASPTDLQSAPFGHSGIPPDTQYEIQVELVDGLEPPTC